MTRQATHRERERKKEGEKIKRETEKRESERERESASTAERGETHMGTKREVKKSCRSVTSQWHHSGDATSNTQRKRKKERESERKRKKEREIERARERISKVRIPALVRPCFP